MQLFESSPEEDNRWPQVPQGPPPVPRSPPALPAGKEKPGRGGRQFGESWLGVIYLFVSMYVIFLPCARAGGLRWGLGSLSPRAGPWARRDLGIPPRLALGQLGLCFLVSGWPCVCPLGWGGSFGGCRGFMVLFYPPFFLNYFLFGCFLKKKKFKV